MAKSYEAATNELMKRAGGGSVGNKAQKAVRKPFEVMIIILNILVAVGLIWGVSWAASVASNAGGQTPTSTPITSPQGPFGQFFFGFIDIFIKNGGDQWTWEALIIRLAVFVILLSAISDILRLFSTFSEGTSYVIGTGLAMIAGVSGAINQMAQLFAFASALSGVGIVMIIFGSIASAVVVNVGAGGILRRWSLERFEEVNAYKSAKGTTEVSNAITALKGIGRATAEGE